MNRDQMTDDWKQIQSKLKSQWSKLTDADLMQIDGKKDELIDKLQKHYGQSKEETEKRIDEFISYDHTIYVDWLLEIIY